MIIRLFRNLLGRITELREGGNERRETNTSPPLVHRSSPPQKMSSSPEFEFPRSYLMDFSDSKEPLIYRGGKIYTLGKKINNSEGGIMYNGKYCRLEELEDISELENQLIYQNQSKIQAFQKEALSFYARQQESRNLENLNLNLDCSSLESFIINYLIPTHIGESHKSSDSKKEVPKVDTNKITLKPIKFLKKESALEMFISGLKKNDKSNALALMNGSVYAFQDNLDNARNYKTTQEFEAGYLKRLSVEISNIIKKDITSCIKKANQTLPPAKVKQTLKNVPSSINGLCFHKNSEKEYIAYINTGKYTIEHGGKFYNFDSTDVGVSISAPGDKITFTERPFIYNHPTYKHPLVFGSSTIKQICLGAANDSSYRERKWGVTSNTSSPKRLAKGILETLRRARNILISGYTNDNSNGTYNHVRDCGRKISSMDAKSLEARGIPIFYGGLNVK